MPSRSEQAGSRRGKRRRKNQSSTPVALIVVIALVVVAAIAVAIFFFVGGQGNKEYYDPAAVAGTYHENGYEDEIGEGALYPLVNEAITVSADGTASIGFENVAANPYELQLQLSVGGEVIYVSGVIKPGSYIESAKLDTVPEAGTHTASARIIAYDAQTQKAVGKVDYPDPVTLTVG